MPSSRSPRVRSFWLNTWFEPEQGRVQYAYVVPDMMVALITLRLSPQGERTAVEVSYARTALSAAGNDAVRKMAEHDGEAGPEWEAQINSSLH